MTKSLAQIEESVGTTLLKALLLELKMQSPRFQTMDEEKQQEVIDRLRGQVAEEIKNVVAAVSARSFASVNAKIVSVTFKEGVKVQLEIADKSEGAHAVADSVGGAVMLVLANLEEFTGGMAESVKPTAKQRDAFKDDGDARAD
jgi:uncharacterized protein YaaW (UPF0174 family)